MITQSDFHLNPFSGFRHTPSRKSPLLLAFSLCQELFPFIIIIQMSYLFVMQLIIDMFLAPLKPCVPLDQYLNPNLYTIPNMQNMRFFCCSVYFLYEQFLIILKLNFIKLSDLPRMLLVVLRTCITCVLGATPMTHTDNSFVNHLIFPKHSVHVYSVKNQWWSR